LHKERFRSAEQRFHELIGRDRRHLLGRATQIAEAGLGDENTSMIEVHPREQYCSEMREAEDQKRTPEGQPDQAGSQF
jgi:hypothetical protein